MKNFLAGYGIVVMGFLAASCGSPDEEGSKSISNAPIFSNSEESAYSYTMKSLSPKLDIPEVLSSDGKAYLVSGEVAMASQDYCEVRAKVAIQLPNALDWTIVRNFVFRAVDGSNSKVRLGVSFALPAGGKFKVYGLELIKASGYPDAPCSAESLTVGGFHVFKIQ